MRISSLARLALFGFVTVAVAMSCEPRKVAEPTGIHPFVFQDVPAYIPADGVSQLEVTATVISTEGVNLPNVPVTFSATEGTLTQSTVLTDSSGIASTYLISIESETDVTGYVSASVDSPYTITPKTVSGAQPQVAPPGSVAIVSAGPLTDEELEARLHAILLKRAYERAQERRKGLGALLGEPEGGSAASSQAAEADRLTVIFEGIEITLSSDKAKLPSDGISTATIKARVRTATRGMNVSGAQLAFAAQEGQITSTATTDDFGNAQVTFTAAISSADNDTITVLLGNTLSDTLSIQYEAPELTIAADDANLPADRNSTTAVRARLLTQAGIPIEGAVVDFSLEGPSDVSVTVQGATNASGEAIAIVKAGETEGTVTVTATFSNLSESTSVEILGLEIAISSEKSSILADGNSTTKITLIAKTKTTNVAVVGKTVTFSTTLGTIPATAVTDASGIAEVTLTSGTSDGTATVTATVGTLSVNTTVDFVTFTLDLSLTASSSSIIRDGESTSAVTVTAANNYGTPLSGQTVTWALSGGTGSISPSSGITNAGGQATITYTADAVDSLDGSGTIQATIRGSSSSITITLLGISLSISSDKSVIIADGNDAATITLQAIETVNGNPVAEKTVRFATNLGSITASATTDGGGKATAFLKSSSIGTAAVTATLGKSRTAAVNVPINAHAISVALSATSTSIIRDGESTSTLTATVTDNNGDPVSNQTVAWSLIGATPSGVSLSASSGVTDANGQTTVVMTTDAGTTDATASVQAATGSSSDTVDITLEGLSLSLTSGKTSIPANGTSTTAITLVAKSQTNNVAVIGKTVTFSTDLGTIPSTGVTDNSGVATTTLTSSTAAGTATITAQIGGVSTTTPVQFAATANITVELSSDKDRILRDGQEEATITATVVDGDGTPLDERVVDFSLTGSGSLSSTQPQQTGASGTATITLRADAATTDSNARIIATSEGQIDTLDIPMRGVSMVLTASPTSIVANGTNTSVLTLLLRETSTNAGAPNRTIQFATTLGTIPATSPTNNSGVAQATLTAGTTSGTVTVTATLGTVSTDTTVNFIAEALNLTLSANKGSILRDGIATTDLTVTVQDPNGVLLDNRDVTWSVTGGGSVFPTLGQTGTDGTHKTTLTADAAAADATATVTVTVGDSTDSVDITLNGVNLTSSVQPDTILANGLTTATFTWQASETTSGAVISNHDIIIAKVSGPSVLLSNVSTSTSASGSASATVTSTTNAGDLIFKATLGGVAKSDTLHLLPDQYSIVLTTDNATLLRDGSETATLTATVTDRYNDPVVNQRVDFALTGNGTLSKTFVNTDANGEAEVTLTADTGSTAKNAQIIASVSTVSDTVSIPLYGVALSIKADPTSLVANGEHESTIEVTVKEAGSSTPLVGRLVTFSVTPGTFATITAQATTDNRGIATAILTADTTASFSATVKGRLGDDPSTTLTDSTSVNIIGSVVNVVTSANPTSIFRDGASTSTVTVTVTDNNSAPLSGKTVSWSVSSGVGSVSPSSGITDASGKASTTYKTDSAANSDITSTVQATIGGTNYTEDILLKGITLSISASPDTLSAGGTNTSTITASLIETTDHVGVSGKVIEFSATLGVIQGSKVTDSNGDAIVTLIPGSSAGTNKVKAIFDVLSDSVSVEIVSGGVRNLTPFAYNESNYTISDSLVTWTISTVASDSLFNPVEDAEVRWSAVPDSFGSIVSRTISDANGVATTTLVYHEKYAGQIISVTARSGSAIRTQSITLVPYIASLDVSASPNSILRDGVSTSTITATVCDNDGNPLQDRIVTWSVSAGTGSVSPTTSTTDINGQAATTFTADAAASTNGSGTVQATVGSSSDTESITLRGVTITASASPDSISANGQATTTVTATLKETTSNIALASKSVTFSTTLGTVESPKTTGSNGNASTTFTAGTTTGTATVTATYGSLSATTLVELLPSASAAIALSASESDLSVKGTGGTETSTITATVWDANGAFVPAGISVQLQATSGTFSNGQSTITKLTGTNGQATFTYQSGSTAGTITFTATSGSATGSAALVTVSFGPATQILCSADTSQTTDLGNGSSTLKVAALVSDTNGAAVAEGTLVAFDITAGGANGHIEPWATTNTTGVAEAILTFLNSASGSTITVRATVGSVSQTLVITLP